MEMKIWFLVCLSLSFAVAGAAPVSDGGLAEAAQEATGDQGKRVKKRAPYGDDEWFDAVYAGRFAIMLERLEAENKPVYTNFISSGFTEKEIPRHLPASLRGLSRLGPPPVPLSRSHGGRSLPVTFRGPSVRYDPDLSFGGSPVVFPPVDPFHL